VNRSWILASALTLAVLLQGCKRDADEENATKKRSDPAVVKRTPEGDAMIQIAEPVQQRIGLRVAVIEQASLAPELIAYGRLEEDPSRSFTLRSPVAGTLQSDARAPWPSIGQAIPSGATVGGILPRILPTDRVTLTNQLAIARSDVNSATASLEAARAAYERARVLNADSKNVSDRVVEEARSRFESERARLEGAHETVRTLESSLQSGGPASTTPLVMQSDGTVVEVMAQPGESVEAGTPLLRISRLDRLVARIDLPLGESLPAGSLGARIVPAGQEHQPVEADRIATAAVIDPKAPGQSFLFRLRDSRFGLRPGLAVTAYIATAATKRAGATVPTAAVVRLSGKAYVYVQTANGQFTRKEIRTDSPVSAGYFIGNQLAPRTRIVVAGGQTLLSEEFKPEGVSEE
jgi:multidrug efflux system membrane fusion protein